jgi:hypothetical protein
MPPHIYLMPKRAQDYTLYWPFKKKKLEKSDRRQTLVLKRISLPSSCTQYKQVNTTIYTSSTTTHTQWTLPSAPSGMDKKAQEGRLHIHTTCAVHASHTLDGQDKLSHQGYDGQGQHECKDGNMVSHVVLISHCKCYTIAFSCNGKPDTRPL